VLALWAAPAASAQTVFEGRYGFGPEYRFVDVSHTFVSGPYLEALYIGVPGQNELYLGAGFQLRPAAGVTLTPVVYAVAGGENDQRGISLGGLLSLQRGGWKVLAFAGHFFRASGGVASYSFVDAFDLTRVLGGWELGASAGLFQTGGQASWLLGPSLKRNDARGAWAFSARFGDDEEYRLIRVLVF